tara:strand:+ start:142713 stop:143690 length:978 start_codon:yes stop_codon:yes gene_type:complete
MFKLFISITILIFSQASFATSSERIFMDAKKNSISNLKTRSLRQLKALEKRGFKPDQVSMQIARVYYDRGDLKNSIKYYNRVPKSSDLWLESIEEKAWAYLRAGDFSKSMEQTMTLLAPVFDQHVNSEVYYLSAVNRYFVCDYEGVFKTIAQFKERYRDRIRDLELLASTGQNPALGKLLHLAKTRKVDFESSAPFAMSLPFYHFRDVKLSILYKKLEQYKNDSVQSERIANRISTRLKKLAQIELNKIKKNIDKLLIVEAEIIQRVYEQNNKPTAPVKKLAKVDGTDYLSFPVTDSEIWVDELNSFEASTSSCPTALYKKEVNL